VTTCNLKNISQERISASQNGFDMRFQRFP